MKSPGEHQTDSFLRSCAIAILIASLLLAGRNSPAHADKTPVITPVRPIPHHNLQVGDA